MRQIRFGKDADGDVYEVKTTYRTIERRPWRYLVLLGAANLGLGLAALLYPHPDRVRGNTLLAVFSLLVALWQFRDARRIVKDNEILDFIEAANPAPQENATANANE